MKKLILMMIPVIFIITGCKKADSSSNPVDPTGKGYVTVAGQVVDFNSGSGVSNAAINVRAKDTRDSSINLSTYTDANGYYSLKFEISTGKDLVVIALKEGYLGDTTEVFATAGRTVEASQLKVKNIATNTNAKRYPAAIYLVTTSLPKIGIRGSGDIEQLSLEFEVVDSSGIPLNLINAVDVLFSIASNPGGGLSVTPLTVKTDAAGRVSCILTSGTRAGSVQILAKVARTNDTLSSLPVAVSIHGGLPDLTHFSLYPTLLNIAGWDIFGNTTDLNVLVGDKYANPVRTGTSVYFTTTGGIIEGSVRTSELGTGNVPIISGFPRPVHPVLGNGFATVTATTADENQLTISRECLVLFSGTPILSVIPTSFDIPNGGGQTFSYLVSDQNGNPLTGGTSIKVSVEGDNVKLSGDTDVELPDTQSPAWTQFSFFLFDNDTSATLRNVAVKISTTGDNGKGSISISGRVR